MKKDLYLFIDEGGDFNFSNTGTKHFTLSCISKTRPFEAYKVLYELKYDLMESGLIELEYFHASEDRQIVRDQIFKIIDKNFRDSKINSIIVQKNRAHPKVLEDERFYTDMFSCFIENSLKDLNISQYRKLIIITDRIPIKRKRNAVEKGLKLVLSEKLTKFIEYTILHHDSKSNFDLQLADYCNWAIYRKWERGDLRSYDLIKKFIKSEIDIFETDTKLYY